MQLQDDTPRNNALQLRDDAVTSSGLGDVLLSTLLPYMNRAPVDVASRTQTDNPHYWRVKLRDLGMLHTALDGVSPGVYKSAYITLYQHNFDVDTAYIGACARDDVDVAMYLSNYATDQARKSCVLATGSVDIVSQTPLRLDDIDEALLAATNNSAKFRRLASMYGVRNVAPFIIGSAPVEAQVITTEFLSDDELFNAHIYDPRAVGAQAGVGLTTPLAQRVNTHEVGEIFQARGYMFPPLMAVDLGLVESVQVWVNGNPHLVAVKDMLTRALTLPRGRQPYIEIVTLLTAHATSRDVNFPLDNFALLCARNNWAGECLLLVEHGANANIVLTEAVRAGSEDVCRALAGYKTAAHLRLARSLGKVKVYNALLSSNYHAQ